MRKKNLDFWVVLFAGVVPTGGDICVAADDTGENGVPHAKDESIKESSEFIVGLTNADGGDACAEGGGFGSIFLTFGDAGKIVSSTSTESSSESPSISVKEWRMFALFDMVGSMRNVCAPNGHSLAVS